MEPGTYVGVTLTEEEMVQLDDGQNWYKPGDEVIIGGRVPEPDDTRAAPFDLNVNGENTCDGWIFWHEIPENIKKRMS